MVSTLARRIEATEWVTKAGSRGSAIGAAILSTMPIRAVGQGQQRHTAVGGDAAAVEGRAYFLAPHAWQIEEKTRIVVHGGRGVCLFETTLVQATKIFSKSVTCATSASTA